jgi:hypothetical protein
MARRPKGFLGSQLSSHEAGTKTCTTMERAIPNTMKGNDSINSDKASVMTSWS